MGRSIFFYVIVTNQSHSSRYGSFFDVSVTFYTRSPFVVLCDVEYFTFSTAFYFLRSFIDLSVVKSSFSTCLLLLIFCVNVTILSRSPIEVSVIAGFYVIASIVSRSQIEVSCSSFFTQLLLFLAVHQSKCQSKQFLRHFYIYGRSLIDVSFKVLFLRLF